MGEPALTPGAGAQLCQRPLLAIGYVLLALGFFAAGFLFMPEFEAGNAPALNLERTKLPRPQPIGAFTLDDIGGSGQSAIYTRERLLGQWTLMYLGYTHCPDVCRPSLAVMAEVARRLRTSGPWLTGGARLEAVFVSLDPARDTPDALRAYLAAAGGAITGVRGKEKQTANLAQQLGILHFPRPADDQGAYLVDHPATILLIDPGAQLRGGFTAPWDTDGITALSTAIAADYRAEH
jgi:protein SCO1/2